MATYVGTRCWQSSVCSSNPMGWTYDSDISEFTHYSELIFDAVHISAGACPLGIGPSGSDGGFGEEAAPGRSRPLRRPLCRRQNQRNGRLSGIQFDVSAGHMSGVNASRDHELREGLSGAPPRTCGLGVEQAQVVGDQRDFYASGGEDGATE